MCREAIDPLARKCKHCGEFIAPRAGCRGWLRASWAEITGDKTAWDFLSLLIVPIMLFLIGYWFNQAQTQRQAQIEQDRSQEAALQAYLDEMTTLLLDGKLRDAKQGDEVWILAQARTLTALRQLDVTRRNVLLRFLRTAELTADPFLFLVEDQSSVSDLDAGQLSHALREQFEDHGVVLAPEAAVTVEQDRISWKIDDGSSVFFIRSESGTLDVYADSVKILNWADLRQADLSGTDLSKADLSGANLYRADLSGANLYRADLRQANLSDAHLSGAYLPEADLCQANLLDADLRQANLLDADLREADLTWADLSEANLIGAKYNNDTIWPDGFDPQAHGAIKVE
jgi:uncharacterized protein YjbI with pentapeptide repeats